MGAGPYPPPSRRYVQWCTSSPATPTLPAASPFAPGAACCCAFASRARFRNGPRRPVGLPGPGQEGYRAHGLPAISTYEGLPYHPKEVTTGGFEWIYEHLGLYQVDGGNLVPHARSRHHRLQIHRLVPRPSGEDDLKMLAWSDTALQGKGATSTGTFEHPQLGTARKSVAGTKSTPFATRRRTCWRRKLPASPTGCYRCAHPSPKLELVHARIENRRWHLPRAGGVPKYRTFAHLRRQTGRPKANPRAGQHPHTPRRRQPRFRRSIHAGELEGRAYNTPWSAASGPIPPHGRPRQAQWVVRAPDQECRGRGGAPRKAGASACRLAGLKRPEPNQRQVLFI